MVKNSQFVKRATTELNDFLI